MTSLIAPESPIPTYVRLREVLLDLIGPGLLSSDATFGVPAPGHESEDEDAEGAGRSRTREGSTEAGSAPPSPPSNGWS